MDDKRFERIEEKVDKVLEHQAKTSIELAVYNSELKEHTRRTTNLENRVAPLEQHVVEARSTKKADLKWWGTIIALVGSFEGIHALLQWLGSSAK